MTEIRWKRENNVKQDFISFFEEKNKKGYGKGRESQGMRTVRGKELASFERRIGNTFL